VRLLELSNVIASAAWQPSCAGYGACWLENEIALGLTTSLSEICNVLKARMSGMGLKAAVRVFGFAKNTILNWERPLAELQETLFLYALMPELLQLVIEGDELYTKVEKNKPASESDRAAAKRATPER